MPSPFPLASTSHEEDPDGAPEAVPRAGMNRIGRALQVRPGEGRVLVRVVALMAISSAGLTVGESGASALLFERVGPEALPSLYLAQGIAGLAVMLGLAGWLARVDRRRSYVLLPLGIGVVVLAERLLISSGATWVLRAVWITAALDWLIQAVFLWGAAGVVTDTRRAKRLFPLFGAGGILGSVAGGLATKPLAAWVGAEDLLFIWAASLAGAAVIAAGLMGVRFGRRPRRRRRRIPPGTSLREVGRTLAFVRRSPLLAWMTAAAVLFAVLFSSLYLPFAQVATARFTDAEELAGFLGLFWAAATGGAFLASVLLANRLLAWIGATAVVVILPLVYAGAFAALLASSALTVLVVGRLVVVVWLQGVASPAWETLVNVVPEERRDQVRAFLGGGPAQVGTAIAGVVTLVGEAALSSRQLATIGLVAASATALVAWRIRGCYAGALVEALRAGRPRVFGRTAAEGPPVPLDVDPQALSLAIRTSRDADPRMRRLAVELLGDRHRHPAALAALEERAGDPDGTVRARSVEALARADPRHDAIATALADPDAQVRRAAVEALAVADVGVERLAGSLDDEDPSVVAAAGVALLDGPHGPSAERRIRRLLHDPNPAVRERVVRRLGESPSATMAEALVDALDDPSAAVRHAALQSLAAVDPSAAVDPALGALASSDRATRDAAFETLRGLELGAHAGELGRVVDDARIAALRDGEIAGAIPSDGDVAELLRAALLARARSRAFVAILAASAGDERHPDALDLVESLERGTPAHVANALEILETGPTADLIRPLAALWEPSGAPRNAGDDWLDRTLHDRDPTIRAFASLLQQPPLPSDPEGATMPRARTSVSPAERILVLRRIPLFTELTPLDLANVAEIAEERAFADGTPIAAQGEVGDELHIVLEGTIAVVREDDGARVTVARRGEGEVVGEMSILTNQPRVASLVADGNVRTLRIGHREFESMLRERPDVALGVMRILAGRLAERTTEEGSA